MSAADAAGLEEKLPGRVLSDAADGRTTIGPTALGGLPADQRVQFLDAFEAALHHVFLTGAVVALVAFLIALNVRELPLRRRHHGPDPKPAGEPMSGAAATSHQR